MRDTTWLSTADDTPFGSGALPYGVFAPDGKAFRVGVRIGERVLDTPALAAELAPGLGEVLSADTLNPLMAAGPARWAEVRAALESWLADQRLWPQLAAHAWRLEDVRLARPFVVADYVDFFSSRHHAENAGAIFRPGQPPMRPNWFHLPVGYHGRAGTVVPSGTPVRRPWGQRRGPDGSPVFAPTAQLDLEAEVGFVVGVPSEPGQRLGVEDFDDHVFGVVLVNDWSARDIQAWEALPLGPFLGKSFATSISSWVLPMAALGGARVPLPPREVPLLDYLADQVAFGLDLDLAVEVNGTVVSRPPARQLYFSPAQQLAHLTVNGAAVRTGDLFASGTVSGPEPDQVGSLLERSWGGQRPFALDDGSLRTFLEDGDEVVLTATAPGVSGVRVGLGEVRGRVVAAVPGREPDRGSRARH